MVGTTDRLRSNSIRLLIYLAFKVRWAFPPRLPFILNSFLAPSLSVCCTDVSFPLLSWLWLGGLEIDGSESKCRRHLPPLTFRSMGVGSSDTYLPVTVEQPFKTFAVMYSKSEASYDNLILSEE